MQMRLYDSKGAEIRLGDRIWVGPLDEVGQVSGLMQDGRVLVKIGEDKLYFEVDEVLTEVVNRKRR